MTWYQSESAIPPAYKKLLETTPPPPLPDLLNCEQFCSQLTTNANTQILNWIQHNYAYFFEQLLIRCLIVPEDRDTEMRKYREPTQSIYLLCAVIDVIGAGQPQNTGLAGSMNGSINASMMASVVGNGCKVSSPQIIGYIIEKMFLLYTQNSPGKLENTLIPGYFNRIFECLNRSHSAILTHTLRTSSNCKLQKLLENHGQYSQISRCAQSILVVFITQTAINTNLQMSVTSPVQTTMPVSGVIGAGGQQLNHPYQLKYRLLMLILQKINKQYKKMNLILFENLLSILLEVVKNVYIIFEGNALTDYICQNEVMKTIFSVALGEISSRQKIEGTQCQLKALELLKYCVHVMTAIDRSNIANYFSELTKYLINEVKPTIISSLMLEVISQWFLIQSGQSTTLFVMSSPNTNTKSMTSSMNSSMNSSQSFLKPAQISPDIENVLTSDQLFKKLLRLCISNPSCNIFQQRVANFISNIFKSQNNSIIDCIFKDNEIIKETIQKLTNFKENPYFGYFIVIIQIYTTRRIDTPVVNQVIELNKDLWNKFYIEILEPHVAQKLRNKLGEMETVPEIQPLQFTVNKVEQQSRKDKMTQPNPEKRPNDSNLATKQFQKSKQLNSKNCQQNSTINELNIVPIQLNFDKPDSQKTKDNNEEVMQPISLKFMKKQSENKQQKSQTESFQSFLKKKMGQSNKLVDERRNKSRTPTKMISGQSKRKKWGTQNDTQTDSIKKPVSVDDKLIRPVVQPPQKQQILPKLVLIKLSATERPRKPTKLRERKINQENDGILMKWMERSKASAKMVR